MSRVAPLGSLLAAALQVLCVHADDGHCTSGITFNGHDNHAYDGDYMLQWLWRGRDGGKRYIGPTDSIVPDTTAGQGTWTISPGCLGFPLDHCNDLDIPKAKGKWVLYSTTTAEAGSAVSPEYMPPNLVVAICQVGCPAPLSDGSGMTGVSIFPEGHVFETVWELTGEKGPQGNFTATMGCCRRRAQKCDGYGKCPSHNTPLGIFSLSCHNDECCQWTYPVPIAVNGHCVPDPAKVPNQCMHGNVDSASTSAILV